MSDVWKDIAGYEGFYQVSDHGRVRSVTRRVWNYMKKGKVLKAHNNGHSYYNVCWSSNEKKEKHAYIHRLVAQAFIPNPDNKEQINHKDFDKSNNKAENLEWATRAENIKHYRNTPFHRDVMKQVIASKERKYDLQVFKYKDQIVQLYDSGLTIQEIKTKLGVGRDFTTRVLRMHGRLK
jgi:hypothetical protein